MLFARAYGVISIGSRNSSLKTSPGVDNSIRSFFIIFYIVGIAIFPTEANPPLIINPHITYYLALLLV